MSHVNTRWKTIAVNGRFLSQRITGVQRYAYELLNAIDDLLTAKQIEIVPVTVFVPPDTKHIPSWTSLNIRKVGRFTGQLWEQIDLAHHARGSLLFTASGGAPLLHDRHVFVIHDAAPFARPDAYSFAYRTYYQTLEKLLARRAKHIITLSQFSQDELLRYLRMDESKISFTWLSGEHILRIAKDDSILEKHGLVPNRFVLAVGSRNPNKNQHGLIAAIQYLKNTNVTVAIAGGSNSIIFGDAGKMTDSVKALGFVSDEELRSLYEHAACFVFPSFYEGFGLPPLEAMTLGTPVVVSRAASLPEVFGDAALYCDPHSPEDIARQISQVLQGNMPSRERALKHASGFTWERCARQTWDVLLRALD